MTQEIRLQRLFCAEISPSRSVVSTFSPHRSPFPRYRRLRGAVRIATGTRLGQWKSCTFTGHIVGVLLKRSVHSCGFTGPRLLPFGGPKPLVEWIRMDIRAAPPHPTVGRHLPDLTSCALRGHCARRRRATGQTPNLFILHQKAQLLDSSLAKMMLLYYVGLSGGRSTFKRNPNVSYKSNSYGFAVGNGCGPKGPRCLTRLLAV